MTSIFAELNSYFEFHERPWELAANADDSYKENCHKCTNRHDCKVFCEGYDFEEEEDDG